MYLGKPLSERCRETCNYNDCNTKNNDKKNKLTVGVYYYPWWGDDFHRGGNPDNPHSYLRRELIGPQQLPLLGEYDDTQPDVIAKHLKWSRNYNIDLWVTSWWGKDRREDLTIKNKILTHPQLLKGGNNQNHRIAIFYETTGRIREKENYSLDNVRPDLQYLCEEYFNHSNYYYHHDNETKKKRPYLFVYLTRKLEQLGLLTDVIALMRQGAKDGGCDDIFIVGDQVFQGPPSLNDEENLIPFDILDGVTNYDVYGSMRGGSNNNNGYVGSREKVTDYYQQEQRKWKDIANAQGCLFIPCVSPGFNDRGVRPEKERIPLSRKLNQTATEGSLFRAALQEARTLVDYDDDSNNDNNNDNDNDNLIMINSFNEWHEDTQIEPCVAVVVVDDGSNGEVSSSSSSSTTNQPFNLTNELEYQAYDKLYLQILKEETKTWDVSVSSSASVSSAPASVLTSSYSNSVASKTIPITEEGARIPASNSISTSSSTEGTIITTISDLEFDYT